MTAQGSTVNVISMRLLPKDDPARSLVIGALALGGVIGVGLIVRAVLNAQGVWLEGVGPKVEEGERPVFLPASAQRFGRVFHYEKAALLNPRLREVLDEYATNGPWPILLTSTVREGAAAALEQAGYFAAGYSKAKTLQETPHGRRAAFDFNVVREVNGDAVVRTWRPEENPDLYRQVAQFFTVRGCSWGGNWKSFVDMPHIELTDWRNLPFPPVGGLSGFRLAHTFA